MHILPPLRAPRACNALISLHPTTADAVPSRPLPPHLAALRDRLRRDHAITSAGVLAFGDPRIDRCLPGGGLPLGQLHEMEAAGIEAETGALTAGFAAALLSRLAPGRTVLWVAPRDDLYPPGLRAFGLDPSRLVFAKPRDDAGVLAAMETALREGGVGAVVGEVGRLDRAASRRVQFACLRHSITGFALRRFPHGRPAGAIAQEATTVATRWRIAALPSAAPDAPAGRAAREPGTPRWHLTLGHARGGRPGAWIVEPAPPSETEEADNDQARAQVRTAYPLRVVAELADHAADAPQRRRLAG